MLEIVHVNSKSEADALVALGYEAVECSFGTAGSALGPLNLDHHGTESWREGVAIRAYRDHYAARKSDPRFVVTGEGDADASFCIAALLGVLPHPSRAAETAKAPEWLKVALTRDLTDLAELVNRVDVNPIGVRLEDHPWGPILLTWKALGSGAEDATAFHASIDRWRKLLVSPPQALVTASLLEEQSRVKTAREAKVTKLSPMVALVESRSWGFDVWYAEVAPVVLAWQEAKGDVTIGCPNKEFAEAVFGPGGLKSVFPKLAPEGWGGREAIGGSPRGLKLEREQALAAAKVVAGLAPVGNWSHVGGLDLCPREFEHAGACHDPCRD